MEILTWVALRCADRIFQKEKERKKKWDVKKCRNAFAITDDIKISHSVIRIYQNAADAFLITISRHLRKLTKITLPFSNSRMNVCYWYESSVSKCEQHSKHYLNWDCKFMDSTCDFSKLVRIENFHFKFNYANVCNVHWLNVV